MAISTGSKILWADLSSISTSATSYKNSHCPSNNTSVKSSNYTGNKNGNFTSVNGTHRADWTACNFTYNTNSTQGYCGSNYTYA